MTAQIEFRVMELLCSRLCHDLISPVMAINNGMELMAEDSGTMADDIRELLTMSAGSAAANTCRAETQETSCSAERPPNKTTRWMRSCPDGAEAVTAPTVAVPCSEDALGRRRDRRGRRRGRPW